MECLFWPADAILVSMECVVEISRDRSQHREVPVEMRCQ